MGALMMENERRLKEIVKLTEDRVQLLIYKKADREATEETISQLVTKADFTEGVRKLRQMHNALQPLFSNEELLQRLLKKLEMMTIYTDEQLTRLEDEMGEKDSNRDSLENGDAGKKGKARVSEETLLKEVVMDMKEQMHQMGRQVKFLYND